MNADKILMGAANIFIGGTAPGSGAAMTITPTNGVGVPSTGGENIGYTDGEAIFKVSGDFKEIEAEQSLSPVRIRRMKEEVTIEFTIKEIDFKKLYAFLNGSRLYDNVSGSPKIATVTGGGDIFVGTKVVVLTSCDPVQQGQTEYYLGICLYKAYMSGDFSMPFSKNGETMVKCTMKGLADASRPVGDQTYQIVQQYA